MNLYEYESKSFLEIFFLPILNSYLIKKKIFLKNFIYKIQVYSGYRKKNKGIDLFFRKEKCFTFINKWKNNNFLNFKIKNILIESFIKIEKEFYFSFFYIKNDLNFVFSTKGGINIENENKKEFLKIKINFFLLFFIILDFLINKKIKKKIIIKLLNIFFIIYKIIFKINILLIEINPIIINNNNIYILDCKIIIDKKNYIFFSEKISKKININYIQLKGNICCIINGAGLAMKTLDEINFKNGKCFSFIDLSGFVKIENLNNLLKIILIKKTKVLLFNIFGGIVSCKKILYCIFNLFYYNFNFKIIIKMNGNDKKLSLKKIILIKNIFIEKNDFLLIKKSILLSNV